MSPSNDDIIQRKAGAWTNRTPAQYAADLTLSNIGGSVTDAQVPNTITLDNITQITTRSHASLQNLTADDHTQYALLAGRSGGQSLYGGTASTDDLSLYANNQTLPNDGLIYAYSHIEIDPGTITFNASQPPGVGLTGTYTMTVGTSKGGNFRDGSTLKFQASSTTFSASLFNYAGIVINDTGYAPGLAPMVGFIYAGQIKSDAQDITQFAQRSFVEEGVFEGTNGGILRSTSWERFVTRTPLLSNVRAGGIVLNGYGFKGERGTKRPNTDAILHNYTTFYAQDVINANSGARDFQRAIDTNLGDVDFGDDVRIKNEADGILMYDRNDGVLRRLYVDTAAVALEAVEFYAPRDFFQLFAYDRADQANVGGVADGADITLWHDKSGSGRDRALGGGTDYPTWDADTGAFSNNQPAVSFTRADSQSIENTRDASIQPAVTGPWSWWAMVSFKSVANDMKVFCHNTGTGRGVGITSGGAWYLRMGSGGATTAGTVSANTMYLMRVYCTTTTQELFIDEVSMTSGSTPQNMVQAVFGAHRTGTPVYSDHLDGDIYEGGFYNAGDISTTDYWPNYIAYLNTRYGTTI